MPPLDHRDDHSQILGVFSCSATSSFYLKVVVVVGLSIATLFQSQSLLTRVVPTTILFVQRQKHHGSATVFLESDNEGRSSSNSSRDHDVYDLNNGGALTASLFWYGDEKDNHNENASSAILPPLAWIHKSFRHNASTRFGTDNENSNGNLVGVHYFTRKKKQRQSSLTPAKRRRPRLILLGERHSGTTFLTRYLQDCFQNARTAINQQQGRTAASSRILVDVDDRLGNTKHWFQPSAEYVTRYVEMMNHRSRGNAKSSSSSLNPLEAWWEEIVGGGHNNNDRGTNYTLAVESARTFFDSAVVLVVVRDPYDWVEAMRRKPWHWPNHMHLYPIVANKSIDNAINRNTAHDDGARWRNRRRKMEMVQDSMGPTIGETKNGAVSLQKSFVGYRLLDWREFVKRPLHLTRQKEDDKANTSSTLVCQKGLPCGSVSPCARNPFYVPHEVSEIPKSFLRHLPFALNDPVYEKDLTSGSGRPFDHLLQLRKAKLLNFLAIPNHWDLAAFVVAPYERLQNGGLAVLVGEIGSALQIDNRTITCPDRPFLVQPSYNISSDFQNWITSHAYWEVESLFGYNDRAARNTT